MKKDRKAEIIQTAASLFRQKGYNAVSMRDLAKALGIKAASLYNHIPSKQAILSAIILAVAERFTQHMDETFPQEISSIDKLEAIIANHIDITLTKTDFLACMNTEWMHLEETDKKRYLLLRNEYERRVRVILETGMQKGELVNTSVEISLFNLLSTLRTLYLWYAKKSSVEVVVLKKDLPKIILNGMVVS